MTLHDRVLKDMPIDKTEVIKSLRRIIKQLKSGKSCAIAVAFAEESDLNENEYLAYILTGWGGANYDMMLALQDANERAQSDIDDRIVGMEDDSDEDEDDDIEICDVCGGEKQ